MTTPTEPEKQRRT